MAYKPRNRREAQIYVQQFVTHLGYVNNWPPGVRDCLVACLLAVAKSEKKAGQFFGIKGRPKSDPSEALFYAAAVSHVRKATGCTLTNSMKNSNGAYSLVAACFDVGKKGGVDQTGDETVRKAWKAHRRIFTSTGYCKVNMHPDDLERLEKFLNDPNLVKK